MSPIKKSKKKGSRKKAVKKKFSKKAVKKVQTKSKAKKTTPKKIKKSPAKKTRKNIIGKITHYFDHVKAAVVKLKKDLKLGETIHVKGHTTDFTQAVASMQLDHHSISIGKKGQEIGLEVNDRVRTGDQVLRPEGID